DSSSWWRCWTKADRTEVALSELDDWLCHTTPVERSCHRGVHREQYLLGTPRITPPSAGQGEAASGGRAPVASWRGGRRPPVTAVLKTRCFGMIGSVGCGDAGCGAPARTAAVVAAQ